MLNKHNKIQNKNNLNNNANLKKVNLKLHLQNKQYYHQKKI